MKINMYGESVHLVLCLRCRQNMLDTGDPTRVGERYTSPGYCQATGTNLPLTVLARRATRQLSFAAQSET